MSFLNLSGLQYFYNKYIKNISSQIKSLSQNITNLSSQKANISDIANNLTTTASGKMLDARMGKTLNDYIGALSGLQTSAKNNLVSAINACLSVANSKVSVACNSSGGTGTANYKNLRISTSGKDGNGVLTHMNNYLIFHMAVDFGQPTARYFSSFGFKPDGQGYQYIAISQKDLSILATNSAGTVAMTAPDRTDYIKQVFIGIPIIDSFES